MALCSSLCLMDGMERGARGSQCGQGIAGLMPGCTHCPPAALEQCLAVGLGSTCVACPGGHGGTRSPSVLPTDPSASLLPLFPDGAVYALGGMGADTSPQALVRVYEPAKDHWQPLPSMPTPCYGASAFLQGNKIFVLGTCCWGKPSIPCASTLSFLHSQTRE